jgi:hypothetical protein
MKLNPFHATIDVENVGVYNLEDAQRAAMYPMAVSTKNVKVNKDRVTKLAQSEKGSGHDNWLSGVLVGFDLTCSNKMWVEIERYHFFQIVSSQSTMHRLSKFDIWNSYVPYVDERIKEVMKELSDRYNETKEPFDFLRLVYSNPAGCRLTAACVTNYRQLKTMYSQRKTHRLPEWVEFCTWLETLPHSEWITGKE